MLFSPKNDDNVCLQDYGNRIDKLYDEEMLSDQVNDKYDGSQQLESSHYKKQILQ